jgi:hypothetical protein
VVASAAWPSGLLFGVTGWSDRPAVASERRFRKPLGENMEAVPELAGTIADNPLRYRLLVKKIFRQGNESGDANRKR